jgi:hypothetical protein
MPIGNNVSLTDKLIKKTTSKTNIASKVSIGSKTNKVNTKSRDKNPARDIATENTRKMTFYVKQDLLKKLYNFAYWDRHNLTEAFNMILSDGLKDKNTKPKE